eukprot:2810608-Pyramimonas_sp.AAC.2
MADFGRGRGASCTSSYVAIARGRRQENLLIFRPLDRAPHSADEMAGAKQMSQLQVLRGESVDWDEW